LAAGLRITAIAVRQHLNTLRRKGLVSVVGKRVARGHPENVWTVTSRGQGLIFPKKYDLISSLILSIIQGREGKAGLIELIRNAALLYLKTRRVQRSRTFEEQLETLLRVFDELQGYERIEEDEKGYTITLRNCIFQEVVKQFLQVCAFYQALAEALIEAPITVRFPTRGASLVRCVLRIQRPP
jgi:predicted ArsR family transcriptional regulator